jgi:hypothetical protein
MLWCSWTGFLACRGRRFGLMHQDPRPCWRPLVRLSPIASERRGPRRLAQQLAEELEVGE